MWPAPFRDGPDIKQSLDKAILPACSASFLAGERIYTVLLAVAAATGLPSFTDIGSQLPWRSNVLIYSSIQKTIAGLLGLYSVSQ